MSTTHTPGPWHTGVKVAGCHVYSANGDWVADLPDVLPNDERRANALLIAAAPDMLAALRLAHAFLQANYTDADMPDILPTARAAIAKAEGRS